jgi:uncharacterized Tic20 family protein
MENNEFQGMNLSKKERQWAMGCHLIGLSVLLPVLPLIGGLVAVLVLWLLKREEGAFIDEQGKESLNFQISLFIYASVSLFLFIIGIGVFLLFALMIFAVVCIVIAGVKASEGKSFRYPACIRFIQ